MHDQGKAIFTPTGAGASRLAVAHVAGGAVEAVGIHELGPGVLERGDELGVVGRVRLGGGRKVGQRADGRVLRRDDPGAGLGLVLLAPARGLGLGPVPLLECIVESMPTMLMPS